MLVCCVFWPASRFFARCWLRNYLCQHLNKFFSLFLLQSGKKGEKALEIRKIFGILFEKGKISFSGRVASHVPAHFLTDCDQLYVIPTLKIYAHGSNRYFICALVFFNWVKITFSQYGSGIKFPFFIYKSFIESVKLTYKSTGQKMKDCVKKDEVKCFGK